jgi:hypothetical protein
MGLDELDWRPVCCSDHLTATVNLGDGLALNVQQSDGVYGITFVRDGKHERSLSMLTEDMTRAALLKAHG